MSDKGGEVKPSETNHGDCLKVPDWFHQTDVMKAKTTNVEQKW